MEPSIPWYQSAIIRQQITQVIVALTALIGVNLGGLDVDATLVSIFSGIAGVIAVWTTITRIFKPAPNLSVTAAKKEVQLVAQGDIRPSPTGPAIQRGFARLPMLVLSLLLGVGSVVAVTALQGCTTLGVPSPKTFNEKEAAAISSVTGIRSAAASLLSSGKISVEDAKNVQEQADNARAAIVIASSIKATNPEAAENRLTAIIVGLNAISAYLATRGH